MTRLLELEQPAGRSAVQATDLSPLRYSASEQSRDSTAIDAVEGSLMMMTEIVATSCTNVSVVVVEDHDDSRDFLVAALQVLGARVIGAASAAHALRYMKAVRPNVLVTDLSMPDQDGFALLQELRSSPHLKDVPAIAITAHGDLRGKADRSGFQWFMRKPIDAMELCRAIATLAAPRHDEAT